MSLQLLLQASLPAKVAENKPVSPTLLVGLGGSGKEILLRFRRSLVEKYGSLSHLPFLQFMHLDTDTTATAKEQYDIKAEDDPLYDKIRFSPAERINLTIKGGTSKYVEHINSHPHIKRWFKTDGKIAGLGNLGEGAGQIRMASRLGFYHAENYEGIAGQLDRAQGALKDASNPEKAAEHGFDLDPSHINIFVSASLAGGTGGGTFIDMGFLLQRYFPNADRVALLLLPNFFRGYAGGNRARANGYASLTELNFYSFGHPFYANWDGVNAEKLSPPPYSTTYLVDASNEAGLVIGSSGKEYDAYRMCADFLFQEFSISKFSGMKRATRVNLVNFNLDVYTHNYLNEALDSKRSSRTKNVVGDTFPTRFGSFGLASIAFPTERVQNACACRMARSILELWERSLLDDPLEQLFTTFLNQPSVSFVQGSYERRDGGGVIDGMDVEEALLWYDRDSAKSFLSVIWEKAQNIRAEVEAAPNGEKAALLSRHLDEINHLLAKEDSPEPDEWGVWVRAIEANKRQYLHDLKKGIRALANEIADDSQRGVAYVLSLLRELKSLLRNEVYHYLGYFDEGRVSWREEAQRYSHEVRQLLTDVGKHESSFLFRKADLARDMRLLVADSDREEDLGALYSLLYARIMKQVMRRGHAICQEIDAFLGKDDTTGEGLLGEYYQLLMGFQQLKERFQRKEAYFTRPQSSELVISLYREGDVDSWYRQWVPQSQEEEVLKRRGSQILSEVLQASSVTAALERIQTTPPDEVEERLLAHCKKYFVGHEVQPEALRMLMDTSRYSTAEREERIALAYRLAKVWAAPPERGLDHISFRPVSADQRPCLIGVDTNDARRYNEFKNLVTSRIRKSSDSSPAFKGIGDENRGMIIFYNELAGVPAFYPSSVLVPQGLKEAYESYTDKDELHIDKNRFQFGDLIPRRSEEATRYADSLRAFVLGRLLGLLRVKELRTRDSEEPQLRYSFKRTTGLNVEEISLGDEAHAVDYLYRDTRADHDTDRRQLLDLIEETIHQLQVHHHLDLYALLLEFYMKVVYPPSKDQVKEMDVTLVNYTPQYAVLDQAHAQIEKMVSSQQELEQLRTAIATLRGKKIDDPLTYQEYVARLEGFTKAAGRVPSTDTSALGRDRTTYLEVLALDLSKIIKVKEGWEPRPVKPSAAETAGPKGKKVAPDRPCPSCHELIDTRAIVCRHCKQKVAQHIECPHCGEDKVPDDLTVCWRCGKTLPQTEEKIECPQCFGFSGTPEDFPCPYCGYDPNAGSVVAAKVQDETESTDPGGGAGTENRDSAKDGASSASLVQCPNCYEEVQPGAQCPECGGLLP